MFVKTQNGVALVGVSVDCKIAIEAQSGLPRVVMTEKDTGAKTVLGIYLPQEAYTVIDSLASAMESGAETFQMPLSMRYSGGYPLTKKETLMVSEKLALSNHAFKRMMERGALGPGADKATAQSVAKDQIKSAPSAFYNNDGAVVVNVDDHHAYICRYDYLTSKYIVLTYTEPSENGYTVSDKQVYAHISA